MPSVSLNERLSNRAHYKDVLGCKSVRNAEDVSSPNQLLPPSGVCTNLPHFSGDVPIYFNKPISIFDLCKYYLDIMVCVVMHLRMETAGLGCCVAWLSIHTACPSRILCLCARAQVRLRARLSPCLLVCLSTSLSVCLSTCLPMYLSTPLSVFRSAVFLSACLSICLPACLPVRLSFCLFVFMHPQMQPSTKSSLNGSSHTRGVITIACCLQFPQLALYGTNSQT